LTLRKRALIWLTVSISAAVLLLLLEKATYSKALFLLQMPGFVATVSIWGVHSGRLNPVAVFIVFSGAKRAGVLACCIRIKLPAPKEAFKLTHYPRLLPLAY